jgi:hypothetical protein
MQEMPGNQAISPPDAFIRAELGALFEAGLWEVAENEIQRLRRLSIFGGSGETPASLLDFRPAFRDFLKSNEELTGALADIAIRLLGAEKPYRDLAKSGREQEAGQVEWLGKINQPDTVRRPGRGRRDRVLDRVASAIALAETAAQEFPTVQAPPDASPAVTREAEQPSEGAAPLGDQTAEPRWPSRRRAAAIVSMVGPAGLAAYLAIALGASPSHSASHHSGGYEPSNRSIFLCARRSDCLGPGYPVFNSYTNTPKYGDERDFLSAKPVRDRSGPFENYVAVTPGEEELLRIYYDNDGDPRAEPVAGASTARNTRVTVLLPHTRAEKLNVAANITSSNADPRTVGDTVTFYSSKPFNIVYVPYTARLKNRAHPSELPLPNDLLGGGALIGYQTMDGTITGCFCESGLITLRILIE